jgi:hypothetical protein
VEDKCQAHTSARAPLSSAILRLSSLAVVPLLLAGCAIPSLPEREIAARCHIAANWHAIGGAPKNAPSLLAIILYGTTSVDAATDIPGSKLHEQWFGDEARALAFCRYEYRDRDSCEGSSRLVQFAIVDGRWVASPVTFSSCVASTSSGQTHNTSLERTREGQSAKFRSRRARRSARPLDRHAQPAV